MNLAVHDRHAINGDADLTNKNDDGDPPRQFPDAGENDQSGADEHLVRDRVKQHTERRPQVARARKVTVETVERGAGDKQNESDPAQRAGRIQHDEPHKDRGEQDSTDGDEVGDIPRRHGRIAGASHAA